MKREPITISVTSKEVLAELVRQKEATGKISYKTAALSLMPKGVKWFESGEDWRFALWLENLLIVCKNRGNHVRGRFTFNDAGAKF